MAAQDNETGRDGLDRDGPDRSDRTAGPAPTGATDDRSAKPRPSGNAGGSGDASSAAASGAAGEDTTPPSSAAKGEGGGWMTQAQGDPEGANAGNGGGDSVTPGPPAPPSRRAGRLGPASATSLGRPNHLDLRGHHEDPEEAPLDIHKYIGMALRHRWLILCIAAMTTLAGLFYTMLQTPVYRASATIEIKRDVVNIAGVGGFETAEAGRAEEFYLTQYELLRSRALAQQVVNTNGLAHNPAFLRGTPSAWSNLRATVLSIGQAADGGVESGDQGRAVGLVTSGLTIEPVGSSSVVRISFDSPDREIAQRVANAVAEGFMRSNLDRRFEASSYARAFLEERLEELREKLEESEATLVEYAERQGIVTDDKAQQVAQSNLLAANDAFNEAEKELFRAQAALRQATAGDALPESLENAAIKALYSTRAGLSSEYEDKLVLYKPDFPEMVHLRSRISEIDRQIAEEVARVQESYRLAHEAALDEKQSLERQIVELTAKVMDFRNRNIQYTILQREVDTNRSLYDGLLQRYKEIGVAGGIDHSNMTNNVSIVDRAETPGSPYTPNLGYNLALSVLFGLMLGGAAAAGREMLDDTFMGPDEIEEVLGLPVLGLVPRSTDVNRIDTTLDDPDSDLGEAYRSLRTALQFATPASVPPSLLVTSALPNEGKSTSALCIARIFAKLSYKVLLIDADLRRPTLHRLLGCDPQAGLTNILTAGAEPPHVFQFPDIPNLTLLPAGPLPKQPGELLAGPDMASLISVATERFDLVIIDSRPVGKFADAPILSSLAAATLVVVEAHQTSRKRVANAVKRLRFARADIVGVVLNKFDVGKAGYVYGYGDYGEYGHSMEDLKGLIGHRDVKT